MRDRQFRFALCLLLGLAVVQPVVLQAQEAGKTLVVGHRGLMHEAPENTLAAFRACLALRVGFELDVRRTKDGKLVCVHDATLDRTTNARGALSDFTLSDLSRLDAGSRFGKAFQGEQIPTIDEIFELVASEVRGDVLLAVDLKDSGRGLEEEVVALAKKHGVLKHLLFIGLTIESPEIRGRLKAADKAAATARLAAATEIPAAIEDANADWVYVRSIPTSTEIERIHKANKKVFVAGPVVAGHEPTNWAAAAKAGIDAILTDHPLELAQQLRGR